SGRPHDCYKFSVFNGKIDIFQDNQIIASHWIAFHHFVQFDHFAVTSVPSKISSDGFTITLSSFDMPSLISIFSESTVPIFTSTRFALPSSTTYTKFLSSSCWMSLIGNVDTFASSVTISISILKPGFNLISSSRDTRIG